MKIRSSAVEDKLAQNDRDASSSKGHDGIGVLRGNGTLLLTSIL